MTETITSNFILLASLIKENAVFLTIIFNLCTTVLVVKKSWLGWLLKLLLDVFFAHTYIYIYLDNPSKLNMALLINMVVFVFAHVWGFYEWKWGKDACK